MSIVSSYHEDNSASLAKRFAALAAGYLENPPDVKQKPAVMVPLENVFRMLEMFRYDAYGDESREGVLAMEASDDPQHATASSKPWHQEIAAALQLAYQAAYGQMPKNQGIDELQSSLRALVKQSAVDAQINERARTFLTEFESRLA